MNALQRFGIASEYKAIRETVKINLKKVRNERTKLTATKTNIWQMPENTSKY